MKSIDRIIKERKTQKVLAEKPWTSNLSPTELEALASDLFELASCAPYHYRAHENYMEQKELNSCLPYRFYALDTKKCRETVDFISENDIKCGKIKNLLLSADLLFIVTWLPEPNETNTDGVRHVSFEGNLKNMEHIAAVSAAIQNVLLGATARNISSYWSTGGKLRDGAVRDYLEIPKDEIVMGTIFLFPQNLEERDARIIPGALRDEGKEKNSWSKWVK